MYRGLAEHSLYFPSYLRWRRCWKNAQLVLECERDEVLRGSAAVMAASDQQVAEQGEGAEEGTGEEEQGSRASRCFSFWVLARKGQLRAALNEAGSHPINCLVRWKSCSLDGAAQKKKKTPTSSSSHTTTIATHRLHPYWKRKWWIRHLKKLFGTVEQKLLVMLDIESCVCVCVRAWMCVPVCRHVCCAPGRVW